jgi:hypothetical protein
MVEPLGAQVFGAAVGLSIVVAFVASRVAPGQRDALPLPWVAGAALVGLLGWEAAIQVPGNVYGLYLLTVGITDPNGIEGNQIMVVSTVVFAVAAAVAVVATLRRHTWGAVLGIGLALSIVATSVASLVYFVGVIGPDIVGPNGYLPIALTIIAMQAVPALAAAVLLAWPMLPRRSSPQAATGAWTAAPDPEAGS